MIYNLPQTDVMLPPFRPPETLNIIRALLKTGLEADSRTTFLTLHSLNILVSLI